MMVIDDAIQWVMNEALFVKTKEADKMHANAKDASYSESVKANCFLLRTHLNLLSNQQAAFASKLQKKVGGYIAPWVHIFAFLVFWEEINLLITYRRRYDSWL